jgi:hypothetical protein
MKNITNLFSLAVNEVYGLNAVIASSHLFSFSALYDPIQSAVTSETPHATIRRELNTALLKVFQRQKGPEEDCIDINKAGKL